MQIFTCAAVAALCVLPAFAGSNLKGNGRNLFWKDGKVTLRVSRVVHLPGGASGVDRRESAASVHTAVFEAIRSWLRPGRAKLELDLDFTDNQSMNAPESIVTFTDAAPFDTGLCDQARYIACTLLSFTDEGEIVKAVVAFNPYLRHSSLGIEGTHDIGLIMRHEMGHVLGLNHSFLADSVMLAVAEAQQEPAPGAPPMFAVRELGEDDLTTLSALYPVSAVSGIAGTVKRDGAGVAGVRVMAINADSRVGHGAISGEDGGFRLVVAPGDYTVTAEPGDGPATILAEKIRVAEGAETGGVELAVPGGAHPAVESVGVVASGLYAGMARVDLARGRDHVLALVRTPLNAAIELGVPEPAVMRVGAASSPSSAPQLVRQTVRVASGAPATALAFPVRSGASATVLPASMRLVPNPRVEAIEDLETGGAAVSLRPGKRYRIKGSDLAAGEVAALPEFEGAPPPTQLAGVAVRVGGRFVPIVAASAAELIIEFPSGYAPGDAVLAVVSGTLMESNQVAVRLALE